MRVHELAKQLGMTSKDLLARLKERHIVATNHMTSLDEDVVKLFLEERAAKTHAPIVFKGKKEEAGRAKAKPTARLRRETRENNLSIIEAATFASTPIPPSPPRRTG